jgi:hypothetical protein
MVAVGVEWAERSEPVAEHHRYRAIVDRTVEAARAWSEAVPQCRAAWEKIKVKYERNGSVPQPADGTWRGRGTPQ